MGDNENGLKYSDVVINDCCTGIHVVDMAATRESSKASARAP